MDSKTCALLILLLTIIPGCGKSPQTFPVQGMVVFPNGSPLTQGTVEFESLDHKPAVTAIGEIQPNGTFEMGTYETNDGTVPGRHRIAVLSGALPDTREERPEKLPPSAVAERYRDCSTSGLEFKVEPGPNNFLIEVQPPEEQGQKSPG